jgi:peptide/nickel transport system substrate-binding protein
LTGSKYWQRRAISRRHALKGAATGGAGLALVALVGCGDDDDDDEVATTPAATATTAAAATAAPAATSEPMAARNVGSLDLQGENFSKEWWESIPTQVPHGPYTPQRGGTFNWRYARDIPSLDPTLQAAYLPAGVHNLIYNKLLQSNIGRNETYGSIELDPARGLSEGVESPDEVTLVFSTKQGVKWQNLDPVNGRTFTAEDVQFTYDVFGTEDTSVLQTYLADVERIEVPDANTLKITLKGPNADFMFNMSSPYLPIVPREIHDRDGDFRTAAVGTGPFQIKNWARDSRILFEANPDYTVNQGLNGEKLPYLDAVDIAIQPDAAAASAAFRTGQYLSSYSARPNLAEWPGIFENQPELLAQRTVTRGTASFGFWHLNEKPFDDVRVRRALWLAYNFPLQRVTYSPEGGDTVFDWMYWYFMDFDRPRTQEEAGKYFASDPKQAKQLMEAAGLGDGFKVKLQNHNVTNLRRGIELAQQFWKEDLNIDADIEFLDYTAGWAQTSAKSWDGIFFGSVNLGYSIDELTRQHVHSESTRNYIDLVDPTLDDWATKQKEEFDYQERQVLAKSIADRYSDQAYSIWHPSAAYGMEVWHPKLHNYRYYAAWIAYQYKLNELEEIWVDA